ncbi:MAG: protein kinase, partial [Planctomycetota bacterium]
PALDHLHGRGFVHGDLKADNVICTSDGRPVLTDFGLARRSGDDPNAEAGISGSLFAIAPEVLRGLPPDARSDLFSLGTLLHELLVGRKVDAREFYSRFPRLPFLEAAQTEIEEFPEWSRDIVQSLLATDPADRPRSALAVARSLAARLGVDLGLTKSGESLRETLQFPVRLGREDWIEGWIEETRARFLQTERQKRGARRALAPQVLTLPAGEDRDAFLEELRLRATLARVPARRVDLREVLKEVTSSGELDRFARSLAASSAHSCVFLFLDHDDLWAMRAIDMLARACGQVQLSGDPVRPLLLVRAEEERASADEAETEWEHVRVPDLELDVLTKFVADHLDADDEKERAAFARHLHALSGGSAHRVDLALQQAAEDGWIQEGDPKPRLRHGADTAPLLTHARDGLGSDSWESADEDARLLLAALSLREVGGDLATAAEICADFALDRARTTSAIEELRKAGALTLRPCEEGGSAKLMIAGRARGAL